MSPLEIIATSFSLICVLLTIRKSIWCWPTGIVGVLAFALLFYQVKMYADMALQAVFLVQSFYGWYYWLYGERSEQEDQVPIAVLSLQYRLILIFSILGFWLLVGYLLAAYTDSDIPYWDAIAATLSLVANALLARKVLENWLLWISADLLFIGIFIYKELYLSAGTYAIFLVLATTGFITWRKNWLAQKA